MERLLFICPRTGLPVDIGVESELETLLRIRANKVRSRCVWCGEYHVWRIRDAQLAHAA